MQKFLSHLADSGISNPFPAVGANSDTISRILNIFFSVVGALALLFVIIGGFRYIISGGEPQELNNAKNTIIYALVGLAVILCAAAIVNFVFGT